MRRPSEKTKAEQAPGAWAGDPGDVWAGRINQNDVPASERPCYAFGCPRLGTLTDSLGHSPGAVWFCRHHSGRKPEEFGEITRRLQLEDVHA